MDGSHNTTNTCKVANNILIIETMWEALIFKLELEIDQVSSDEL